MSSMINHFKDQLTGGEIPSDPFNDATERAKLESLSEEEKAAMRKAWNKRLDEYFQDREALIKKMLAQQARRTVRRR